MPQQFTNALGKTWLSTKEKTAADLCRGRGSFWPVGFFRSLSPILTVVALAEDTLAGAVLLALNSHPLSWREVAITAGASCTAPNVGFENTVFHDELFISQQPFLVNRSGNVGPQASPIYSDSSTLKRCSRIRR